jgi:acetoin utilization deacetylase AcuC-like enzyme
MTAPALIWDASYEVDLGPHVFVTAKYRLTRERVLEAGLATEDHFVAPAPASRDELGLAHTSEYLTKIENDTLSQSERWQLELPFNDEVRSAMILSCGGTLLTARRALADGAALHVGGGFHHAFAGHGEGFCLLNDLAVAARTLQVTGEAERVFILDLDVHHGNGTAAIFAADPDVFTFSMHQENNYPAAKPRSDIDIGLDDGVGDDEYMALLSEALPDALDAHTPALLLCLAGADPYHEDQLGGLALTLDGLRRRDRFVFDQAAGLGLPVAVVLAGGYAPHLEDTVSIHVATVEELMEVCGA